MARAAFPLKLHSGSARRSTRRGVRSWSRERGARVTRLGSGWYLDTSEAEKIVLRPTTREFLEAQALAEALLDAEVKIGELTKELPDGKPGPKQSFTTTGEQLSKMEAVRRLGLDPMHVNRLETLAAHPDVVAEVKADARENDDLPTRTEVLRRIAERSPLPIGSPSGQRADDREASGGSDEDHPEQPVTGAERADGNHKTDSAPEDGRDDGSRRHAPTV